MTGMPPPTPIFEVASVVPGDDLLMRGNGAASGMTYVAQQAKTTGTSTSTTRYVRTTGLARHRSSSLPPPTPKNIALVTKSKAKAKARSVQGKQQYQQRRRSAPGGKTSSSRAVIHAGTKLPKPYTYEPLTHSTIETVPLNADYPAGSCTINHAVGPAEPRQFYHRFKSTYGRPELNGRHGQIGYYDFRRIGVDVVGGAIKMRGGRLRNNNIGRQKTIRSLRIGKPVRRSVGLSTLWAWDFPPSWVFEMEQETSNQKLGWIDCEPSEEFALVAQCLGGDHGSVAGDSVSGSIFSVDNMKRPGAQVGFGGPFPYDRFLRPEQDPYYRVENDDDDSESGGDDVDAKVDRHMEMLRFSTLPYSFEQCWADQMKFADFDGLKARASLPRPYSAPSLVPPATSRVTRPQFPTQELRPTPEQVERAKKIHQAARIKARQHQNRISRVSDWRHRTAALEAEVNIRRSMRREAVGIKEIYINDDDDTVSVDAEELSLPGVLKVMAALKADKGDAHSTSTTEALDEDGYPIDNYSLGDNNSDGSTILHYLDRHHCNEKNNLAEESIAELTEDGLEEDSREDSTEIKLLLGDDDTEEEDEDDGDDSLAFSKTTSIADILANATSEVDESKDNDFTSSLPHKSKPPAENLKASSLPCRSPRNRPLSIRVSAKKKKEWDEGWGSDMVAVARWHGDDGAATRALNDLCGTNCEDIKGEADKCGETEKRPILSMSVSQDTNSGESTRKDGILRTANATEDDVPPVSPVVSQLPPRGKISPSPSPPRPVIASDKAANVSVSLSEHLAKTGASGSSGMPKVGCEGSIRTMETACSTNPSEDDFVPSPYASGRESVRPDALTTGASARSRRRALEAQFSKQLSNSSKSSLAASRNDPAASLDSARSLEVAILQSLKKKVDDSIGTSGVSKASKTVDTMEMMRKIQNERSRVVQKSKSLRKLGATPQKAGTSATDWNVW